MKTTEKTERHHSMLIPFPTCLLEIIKFEMKADMIDSGGVKQPVFLVTDPKPFEKPGFTMGSLTEASTSGNWKE